MDAADVLYGVSMGGDGVTKVVSRRLPREVAEAGDDEDDGGADGDARPSGEHPARAVGLTPATLANLNRPRLRTGVLGSTLRPGKGGGTMAQRHMDRLTSFDTSFLANEKANGHMAIGAVLMCEGSAAQRGGLPRPHPQPRPPAAAPAPAAALPAAGARHAVLGRLPGLRHPPAPAPGHPAGARAPRPSSGTLVGELLAPPLDRSKPLWELILVEGFEDDRFAIVYKTHHAMADGISAVDIGMLLFDVEPKPEPVRDGGALDARAARPRGWPWSATPAPGSRATLRRFGRWLRRAAARARRAPAGAPPTASPASGR